IQWQDRNDNFYIATNGLPGTSSTVWMYHMDLNQWEWHSGDSALNSGTQNRKFISQCVASVDRDPGHRLEARGCNYLDRKGCSGDSIFWFYGGAHSIPPLIPNNNDLWIYNRLNNTWKWVSGDSTLFTAGNYGVQGVPSLTTMPYSMNGHAMWVDKNQQVWVWGGKSDVAVNNNNMWRFTPDTSCVQWTPNQFAVLSQPPNSKICLGDSVLVSILPSQTYTVAPSFGTAINAANTEISFHPISTTTYTITASSNQDCVAPTMVSFTIQVDTLPLVNPLMNDTICNGQSALLSVSNPPVGMQFLWLPMNTSGSSVLVTPSSNTVYTLVSGYSGSACPSDTQTVSVIVSNLTWNSVSSVNVLCFGGANGSINTNALGTGSILYTIQPLNINNSTGVFTGLTAAVYTLIASDAGNCSLTTLVSVVQPAPIVANIVTSTQPSCNTTTGTLQAFASGGTGTLSYTLQPLGITNTTGYFNNLAQGVYTVVATDGNACSASTTLNLFAPNAVQIQNVTTTSSGCNGINTGSAVINANGNATPFQFSIGGPFQVSNNFTNLASGNYTVIVVDTNGCSDTTNFSILTKNPPTISSLTLQQPLCPAEADGSASVIAFGDTTLVSIVLQPGNNNQSNGIFTQLASGSYTITVTDASGCSTTTAFTMIEPPAITVQISQVINSVCNVSELGSIQSSAFGGNGALTFTLLPPNITNITGYFDQLLPGKYQVVVTDSKNCMKGDSVEITRIPCCKDIEIPNAFTPNGDLLNDELNILNADHIELIKFVIANRWGNLVYQSETLSSWNGTYKNEPAASDTYYYFVTYKCKLDGKEYMKKGDIILMR
ncbi:MAG: gliding motility-associated C-terminal domain-containing protein, partial [Chitinophagaceae bacterium]|nr:gliding motility-associated C-terminal domain-containing protein [Chitinophagaceae bacterium]